MSFPYVGLEAPEYLWALLIVPLLFAFTAIVRRRRSRYGVAFTHLGILARISARRRSRWSRRLPILLLALAAALMAAAAARPMLRLTSSNRGTSIVLLADVSGSMAATDVYPERIYAAVKAMRDFVAELPADDRVGLVTFSDKVEVLSGPTTDHAGVASELSELTPEGGTALGEGVETAVRVLQATLAGAGVHHVAGSYLPAAIVLESDGAQDRGAVTPFAAAKLAAQVGIRIYGVALGTRYGYISQGAGILKESFRVPPDPDVVALLARESGGTAFNATSATALDTVYRQLGTSIGRRRQDTEITSWVELAAAVLLAGGVAAARLRGPALP